MSSAGIMILITNDGKQDLLLFAFEQLVLRLNQIRAFRRSVGAVDEMPTIADIEKTHILFTNATFKPFVQTTTEYRLERAQGQYTLGDTADITIDIKHFGDFFSDMILYFKLSTSGLVTYKTDTLTNIEDRPLLRWCNYPGERILKNVKFEINGTIIDEYQPMDSVVYRQYMLPINKRLAYDQLMGQETPQEGYISRDHVSANADGSLDHRVKVQVVKGYQTPKYVPDETVELWVPLKFWFNRSFKQAIPSVALPSGNRCIKFQLCDANELVGLVTRGTKCRWENAYAKDSDFKAYTGIDADESCATIDYTKLKISEMSLWVNHLFVQPEIHEIYLSRIGFSLVRVHKKQNKIVSDPSEEHKMNELKWPIETLFIGVKPTGYDNTANVSQRARYLDRWDKYTYLEAERVNVIEALPKPNKALYNKGFDKLVFTWNSGNLDSSTLDVSMSDHDLSGNLVAGGNYVALYNNVSTGGQLAFNFNAKSVTYADASAATITLKGRHPDYSDTTVYKHYDSSWGAILTHNTLGCVDVSAGTVDVTVAGCASATPSAPLQIEKYNEVPMITSIKVTLHGVEILDTMKSDFLSKYVPYRYGGYNINPPTDNGLHMVNFALHPGQYQPSGHVNISRAREFYITYNSDHVGSTTKHDSSSKHTGNLHVIAMAINFLLISDGSAVLRYIT